MSAVSSAESQAVAGVAANLGGHAVDGRTPRECLIFRLGAEEYAIDILRVQEIRSFEPPTRVAGAPADVLGVINLRGVIVPVVDLRLQFAQPEARYDNLTVVVVLNVRGRVVGAVVDAVSDVIELSPADVKPAPEFHGAASAGHILGIAPVKQGDGHRMLILMDIESLMAGAAPAGLAH